MKHRGRDEETRVRGAEKAAQRGKVTIRERRQSIQKRRMYVREKNCLRSSITLRSNSYLVRAEATLLCNRIHFSV